MNCVAKAFSAYFYHLVFDPERVRLEFPPPLNRQNPRGLLGDGAGGGPLYGATYVYPYGDGYSWGDQQGGGTGSDGYG